MLSFTSYELLQKNFTPYDGAPLLGGVRTKKDKQPRNFHLNITHCSLHFVSAEVYRCHKINTCTLFFALNVFLSERRNFAGNKISI